MLSYLKTKILIGPTYYQRIKQMVKDKINSRAPGSINYLTKQPPAGKAAGGGLRIGEMERDSLISHGLSAFIKESYTIRSDNYKCFVCKMCGRIAIVNEGRGIYKCNNCNNSHHFNEARMPYCSKLFIQEAESMNICLRLVTEK